MAEFMANLDRINGLGDACPGFVWRLQDDDGNATGLDQPFGPDIIVNLTVWESVEYLRGFVFRTEHAAFLRRRGEWFSKLDHSPIVLWWVRAASPVPGRTKVRLGQLIDDGPAPAAFSFARAFGADGRPMRRAVA